MRLFIRIGVLIATAVSIGCTSQSRLTPDQRLIVASHEVDYRAVQAALRDGADVNGTFGAADNQLLLDEWHGGWPTATTAENYTPLLALAAASRYPDPPRINWGTDREWERREKAKVPGWKVERRRREGLQILELLLSRGANVNTDDGHGGTPLHLAVRSDKSEMVRALLAAGAEVNTSTGIYIDGPGGLTPLHSAAWSPEITKLLLDAGADPTARDTRGDTPLDYIGGPRAAAVRQVCRSAGVTGMD